MISVKAALSDVEGALAVVRDAIAYLGSQGVDQWQNGYPNIEVLKEDAEKGHLYVIKDEDKIVGVYVLVEHDPNYDVIEGGWSSDAPYIAVHRFCVKAEAKRKGVGTFILREIAKDYEYIRIDTHKDNIPMNSCLKKNGFTYCGVIHLEDGAPRVAYDFRRQ